VAAAAVMMFGFTGETTAEIGTIRLAEQPGLGYLPLMVMREFTLIEKHVEKPDCRNRRWNG
jgi:hypothetical protein